MFLFEKRASFFSNRLFGEGVGGKDVSPPLPIFTFFFSSIKNALHFCKAFRDKLPIGRVYLLCAGSVHPASS